MTPLDRRGFLKAAGFGAAGATIALSRTALAEDPVATDIIDTHTHFYDPTRPEGVPWPGKDDALLYRKVLPDDYKRLAVPHGVTGTVVVEASPWLEDNQWLLDLADQDPFLIGIVGNLDAADKDFRASLKRFAKHPRFRGIRVVNGPLKAGLKDKQWVANIAKLAEHDLELDINGPPEVLPDVARLAKRLPELRIVINHAANLRIDGKTPPRAWLADIEAAAKHPQVFMKVSGLVEGVEVAGGKAPSDVEFYKPALDALWQAFGEDRLIYGSNWPVSERYGDYSVVQGIVEDYFQLHGATALKKFFRLNALAAYKTPTVK